VLQTMVVQRLKPGVDLKDALEELSRNEKIQAGAIVSLVGSLTAARLRLAGGEEFLEIAGPLEIVSGTGTVSKNGFHIHIAVSDNTGRVLGGHLVSGCLVRTTVEVVLANLNAEWKFTREIDNDTGYLELVAASCGPSEEANS
jgi:uncharacterized protein